MEELNIDMEPGEIVDDILGKSQLHETLSLHSLSKQSWLPFPLYLLASLITPHFPGPCYAKDILCIAVARAF